MNGGGRDPPLYTWNIDCAQEPPASMPPVLSDRRERPLVVLDINTEPLKQEPLDEIAQYVTTDPSFNYNPEDQETIRPPESTIHSTFDRRMYEHLEGINKLQLTDRPELLVWRQLNPVLALFYETTHKFLYDATKINLAQEVRLN